MIETQVIKQEALPSYDVGSKYVLKPSPETLDKLGEFLRLRLDRLRHHTERSEWGREKARAFEAYHMIPKKRALPFPGAANLASPLPRIGVDAFHANVMASLFLSDNRMQIVPVLIQKEAAATAQKAARYMTYVMNQEADAYTVIDDADKKAQMFGVGYLEPCYVREEAYDTVDVKETIRETTLGPDGQPVFSSREEIRREKKKRIAFDGIRIQSLPVDSVFVSPFIRSIEQAVKDDAVFKLFSIDWATVKERSKEKEEGRPTFYLKSQVDRIGPSVMERARKSMTELELARAHADGFFMESRTENEQVELAEGFCWFDVDGDGIKEEIKATFDPATGIVLRVTLSKCRIVEMVPRPIDERFHGEGIPRICEPLSDEWENFHNTRANAGQWENTTFGFYRAGGRFNPQTITIQPGRFYPVDDPREVSFPQTPRVGSSYFQEEQMILSYFERIFALDENMQGVGSARRRTATESIRVSSKASIRFMNPFNRTITQINKLLGHIWDLSRECAPPDKEFYIAGEDGTPLFDKMDKYAYGANLKFSVAVSSVFDQQLVRDTMLLAYRLYITNPFVANHPETLWDLSQKTLDSLQVDVKLPKPPQAKVPSAYEAIELIKDGKDIEPEPGMDYDHQIDVCLRQLQTEDIAEWDREAVAKLIVYIDKLKILKGTLESANLNKSGVFSGAPMLKQPGVTANRNPTQTFNTMRVAETGNSMRKNVQNGIQGQNASEDINQVLGGI